jgi:hypothetical protein
MLRIAVSIFVFSSSSLLPYFMPSTMPAWQCHMASISSMVVALLGVRRRTECDDDRGKDRSRALGGLVGHGLLALLESLTPAPPPSLGTRVSERSSAHRPQITLLEYC